MRFKIFDAGFRDRETSHRDPGLMDRLSASGNQRVPFEQRLPLRHQSVGTGDRQPMRFHSMAPQIETAGDMGLAPLVMPTATLCDIEEMARKASKNDFAIVFILELIQTASATTITQGLPLCLR